MNPLNNDQKINILLVGPFPPPPGGVATMNSLIVKIMDKSSFYIIPLDTAFFKKNLMIKSVTGILNIFMQFIQFIQYIYLIYFYRCSIVHLSVSSYLSFYKSVVFIFIARLLHKKIIVHLHGGAFKTFYHRGTNFLKKMIFNRLKGCDCIITLSNSWRNFLINDVKIPPNKIRVLNNCYDLEVTTMENSIQPFLLIRKKPIIHILFMGSLKSNKGVLDLIHSCAYLRRKLKHFILYIAGKEGEKNIKSQILDLIDQYQMNDHIMLVGEVSGKDKLDLLFKSDLFILPSYVENFPVTILEAMRAALPVISTPIGAIEEIIQDGKNGYLVSPGDIHGFAKQLFGLMKNRRLRHYMSKNNLDTAIERYDPYDYRTNLSLIYQMVSGRR